MNRSFATGLSLSLLPSAAIASGDPAVLLLPLGMLLSIPLVIYLASRASPNWLPRSIVVLLGLGAVVPLFFLKGDASAITYFISGFAPPAATAYIASELFRRRKTHAT